MQVFRLSVLRAFRFKTYLPLNMFLEFASTREGSAAMIALPPVRPLSGMYVRMVGTDFAIT